MTAEGAREPEARRKLADLRHAMQRIAEHARPGVLDFDLAELGVDRHHVGLEPPHVALGIGLPRGRVSRPEQAVVADDAVVVVGEVGIGHRAAIGDGLGQARTERRGGDRIAPDRHHRAGDARLERAEMDVAGKHDMAGAHARGRRDDPLAHAFDVDCERRRILEDARSRRFCEFRQPERIVERMDVKCARQMHGVEVVIGLEHLAHALGRPGLDLGAELLTVKLDRRRHLLAVVDLGCFEPAGDRRDAGHARLRNRRAHVFEAHLGERPQRLGVLQSDAADQPIHGGGKAGQNETVVAAGRAPGDAAAFHHHHRPPAPCDLACRGEPGKARADHADIDVEIEGERPARGRRHHTRRVPGRHVGGSLGRVHLFFPGGQVIT